MTRVHRTFFQSTCCTTQLRRPTFSMVNPLPVQLDGVMTYAELETLHLSCQLDTEATRFYYAVNKRASKSTPEEAFLHQKRIALDARLKREAARHRPTVFSVIPSSSPSSSSLASSSAPDNLRKQCRVIMDTLRFDPPADITSPDPFVLLRLPEPVRELLLEEKLTLGQAQVVLVLNNAEDQVSLAKQASHGKMSVRQMQEQIATTLHTSRCVNCPHELSKQMCWGILELWCRGQLQTHHVRFLLRELMSVRLMEEIGDGARAPERRIAAEDNSCYISRKFAQGVFEPSFSDMEQYRVKAPLSSADGVFDLLWLHRKQGLHVMKNVVHLVLNLYGERETGWLLAVIGLETHAMSMLAPSRTFQVYLEELRGRLTDRLHQLDAEFNQPRPTTTQGREEEEEDDDDDDDDDDAVGVELRQVAADLERLQVHCTAVELREREQRRRAEEQQRREEKQRREEDNDRIRQTFRYKQLVEQDVAARSAMIRAQAMREHEHEVQELLTRQKQALTVVWEMKVQEAWDQAERLASNVEQAKAWQTKVRVQERRVRREKVAELGKQGIRPKKGRQRVRTLVSLE